MEINTPFHDGSDIDATITSLGGLPDYGYAKKVNRFHIESDGDDIEGHGGVSNRRNGGSVGEGLVVVVSASPRGTAVVSSLLLPSVAGVQLRHTRATCIGTEQMVRKLSVCH